MEIAYLPSMSRAVPIAWPLAEGFSVRKAIHCAHLVEAAYDLYQQGSAAHFRLRSLEVPIWNLKLPTSSRAC
jgi:hypothetical protein